MAELLVAPLEWSWAALMAAKLVEQLVDKSVRSLVDKTAAKMVAKTVIWSVDSMVEYLAALWARQMVESSAASSVA